MYWQLSDMSLRPSLGGKKVRSIPLVCSLLILAVAGIAGAATLTETVSEAIPLTSPSVVQDINVDPFDTTLGTLTGVSLNLDCYVQGTLRMENMDSSAANIDAVVDAVATLALPNSTGQFQVTSEYNSDSYAFTKYDGLLDFSGNSPADSSGVITQFSQIDSAAGLSVASSNFSSFEGSSVKLELGVTTTAYVAGSNNGNVCLWPTISVGGTQAPASSVSVVYTYVTQDVTPEPAGLAALATGLCGLAWSRFRQRRR